MDNVLGALTTRLIHLRLTMIEDGSLGRQEKLILRLPIEIGLLIEKAADHDRRHSVATADNGERWIELGGIRLEWAVSNVKQVDGKSVEQCGSVKT